MFTVRTVLCLVVALAVFVPARGVPAQVPQSTLDSIKATNADVTARSIALAVEAYLDARETKTGQFLGVLLCDAKLKTGVLPRDARSSQKVTETVDQRRRATCGGTPGSRSVASGSIQVDSVVFGVGQLTIYTTVRQGGSALREVATLEPVGWGQSRHWLVRRIE